MAESWSKIKEALPEEFQHVPLHSVQGKIRAYLTITYCEYVIDWKIKFKFVPGKVILVIEPAQFVSKEAEIIFKNAREERFFFRATRGLLNVDATDFIASVIFLQT